MYRVPCCSFLSLCSFFSTDTLFCYCLCCVLSLFSHRSLIPPPHTYARLHFFVVFSCGTRSIRVQYQSIPPVSIPRPRGAQRVSRSQNPSRLPHWLPQFFPGLRPAIRSADPRSCRSSTCPPSRRRRRLS
ncbi:hypothetical protein IQ07DRAFT_305430 [Pyrenochaeta sp. DS3sAY3a]|nr:hypothetical protein IQ07DRAFT_305430 [Pyrenochaeta sp. DS3sAY3a]